eukprot:6181977-Pleurochrysis_carterae.AAC.3
MRHYGSGGRCAVTAYFIDIIADCWDVVPLTRRGQMRGSACEKTKHAPADLLMSRTCPGTSCSGLRMHRATATGANSSQ